MPTKQYKTPNYATFVDPEIATDEMNLQRKMALAKALTEQGMSPLNTDRAYAISPLEGVAKMAQALAGVYLGNKADEEQSAMAKRQNEALVKMLTGKTGNDGTQVTDPNDFSTSNLLKGKAIEQLGGTAAAGAYWDNMKATPDQKNWAAQGIDPKQLGQLVLGEQKTKSLMSIPQGNTVYDPLTGQTGFTSPKLSEGQVYQNGQVFNAPGAVGAAAQMEGAKAGAEAGAKAMYEPYQVTTPDGKVMTTNKFDVSKAGGLVSPSKADLAASEKLQTATADQLISSGLKATEASQNLLKLGRLRDAVDSGKIITGPGADWRLTASQIANNWGIQGKDDQERLLRTREVIQGLARMSLDNVALLKDPRVTDQERAMLKDAASGDLSRLTAPELSKLLGLFDTANRDLISQNNAIADRLKDQPAFEGAVRHYRVPMPEEYRPASARAQGQQGKGNGFQIIRRR